MVGRVGAGWALAPPLHEGEDALVAGRAVPGFAGIFRDGALLGSTVPVIEARGHLNDYLFVVGGGAPGSRESGLRPGIDRPRVLVREAAVLTSV